MKLVIVILILVGVVFAVGAGECFRKPRTSAPSDPTQEAKDHKRSGFEKFLGSLSLPSGGENPLKKSLYHASDPLETVGKAEKIRRVKLQITHDQDCSILVEYHSPASKDSKLKDQPCHLPRLPDEAKDDPKDKDKATFVLLTTGGTLQFGACSKHKTGCPAKIEVVK